MRQIFRAAKQICDNFPDVKVVYPVHKNPSIRELAAEELGNHKKILLSEPLDPLTCHNIMSRCYAILTDSGGIQEEATALKKPTLVLRDRTERPEGVEAGILKLVGTSESKIYFETAKLLTDTEIHKKLMSAPTPYGIGNASQKIADIICN